MPSSLLPAAARPSPCVMLDAALPETRFQVHYVKVTGLSKRDLCKEIADRLRPLAHRHLSRI